MFQDYGSGRGVFDISLSVDEGECYGFLGPNGAGKTTTIRHMMGFSKAKTGSCQILHQDVWKHAASLQSGIGYLPGEISFPSGMSGSQFLKMEMAMRRCMDDTWLNKLLERFAFNPDMEIKRMSLGEKRKLAIVSAFLHDPRILILDEPTSGLDPLMQRNFIEFVREEKARGKTIFLSSHIFSEVDAVCDRIAIIKDGRIISEFNPEQLREESDAIYRLTFETQNDLQNFLQEDFQFISKNPLKNRCRVCLKKEELGRFIETAGRYPLKEFEEIPYSLEEYFLDFYRQDKTYEGVAK